MLRSWASALEQGEPDGLLDGGDVCQGVPDGRVAADPFGELDAVVRGPALEELFDPAVDEPQPGLHPQDGLADDGEAEVPGLDEAGMHRSHRDLVHPVAADLEEGKRAGVRVEHRVLGRVVTHRVVAGGPMAVPDESLGQVVSDRGDAVEVAHLAFETARGVGQACQGR
ncbi:MAG: hypothetical protein V9G08_10275 [Dermatophilaceae bacterium]